MFETIDKLMMAGLGAAAMTKEKAEKIFDEYLSRGKAEAADKTGFVKELMDRAGENKKNLEHLISEQFSNVATRLNFATKEDIQNLEAKIDRLLEK